MADFDFSTLITDRSASDLELLRDLLSTPMSDWTAEQLAAFNQAVSKGAYNYTDLNRVTEAMEALDGMLSSMGYKTGYAPVVVHPAEPAPPSQYTYRYFRMQINAVRSGTQMQMSEIRLVDDNGNFFQFPAGTTVSSTMSVPVANEGPTNLIDGLVTTKYYTNAYTTGGIITIDLGDGQEADLLVWTKWQWYTANDEPNRDPVSFVFQGSRDGADWVTLDEAEGATITEARETLAYTGNLDIIWPEVPQPEPEPTLDPYTWYEADTPRAYQMSRYLQNVSKLRETLTLPESTLEVPDDMVGLTQTEANNIETILGMIETWIQNMMAAWFYSGDLYAGEV